MAKKGKTHKATVKRFKITSRGKLLHKKQGNNEHMMAHKSARAKNRKKNMTSICSKDQTRNLKRLIRAS